MLNPIRLLVLSQLALRVSGISCSRLNRHLDRHHAFRKDRLDQDARRAFQLSIALNLQNVFRWVSFAAVYVDRREWRLYADRIGSAIPSI